MILCNIETCVGVFTAQFSESGLVRLQFPSEPRSAASSPGATPPPSIRVWVRRTAEALRATLCGRTPGALPPLDWSTATPCQQAVWAQLQRIAPGQVRTYVQVAQAIGRPYAARAVGGACGANLIPVLVPCHRVVAAHGGLGGFSGGLSWKVRLLALEGRRDPNIQRSTLNLYGWFMGLMRGHGTVAALHETRDGGVVAWRRGAPALSR